MNLVLILNSSQCVGNVTLKELSGRQETLKMPIKSTVEDLINELHQIRGTSSIFVQYTLLEGLNKLTDHEGLFTESSVLFLDLVISKKALEYKGEIYQIYNVVDLDKELTGKKIACNVDDLHVLLGNMDISEVMKALYNDPCLCDKVFKVLNLNLGIKLPIGSIHIHLDSLVVKTSLHSEVAAKLGIEEVNLFNAVSDNPSLLNTNSLQDLPRLVLLIPPNLEEVRKAMVFNERLYASVGTLSPESSCAVYFIQPGVGGRVCMKQYPNCLTIYDELPDGGEKNYIRLIKVDETWMVIQNR